MAKKDIPMETKFEAVMSVLRKEESAAAISRRYRIQCDWVFRTSRQWCSNSLGRETAL